MKPSILCLSLLIGALSNPSDARVRGELPDRNTGHPRLLISDYNPADLTRKLQDSEISDSVKKLVDRAEELLEKTNSSFLIPTIDPRQGGRLSQARQLLDRVHSLSIASFKNPEQSYLDRLWFDVEAACDPEKFPDWGPVGSTVHSLRALDVSEFGHAVALAYDWFYDRWTEQQKESIRKALWRNVLLPGMYVHGLELHPVSRQKKPAWWVAPTTPSNWNFVSNTGLIMAGLAVIGDYEDSAKRSQIKKLLEKAIASMQRNADQYFGPKGGIAEGVGYWPYSLNYLALGVESLLTGTGSGQGFLENDAIGKTANYFMSMVSNTAFTFAHGDSGSRAGRPAVMQWLAKRYDNPKAAAYSKEPNTYNTFYSFLYSLFYTSEGSDRQFYNQPLLNHFPGPGIVTYRSDWRSKNATFLAFKGGDNQAPHGHLDLGSFVYQQNGMIWFEDLGKDSYSLPGYFAQRKNYYSKAWDYYRLRVEGHNTFVLNPSEHPGQNILAKAEVFSVDSRKNQGVVDLSKAYKEFTKKAYRGFAVMSDKKTIVIKDELREAKESRNFPALQYYWMAHTQAKSAEFVDPSIRNAVVLYQKPNLRGKRLLVQVLEPGLEFEMDADQPLLPAAYLKDHWQHEARQADNSKFKKLILRGSTTDDLDATVVLHPLEEGQPSVLPELDDERLSRSPSDW